MQTIDPGAESSLLMEKVEVWLPFTISPPFLPTLLEAIKKEKDRIVLIRMRIIKKLHTFVIKIK